MVLIFAISILAFHQQDVRQLYCRKDNRKVKREKCSVVSDGCNDMLCFYNSVILEKKYKRAFQQSDNVLRDKEQKNQFFL